MRSAALQLPEVILLNLASANFFSSLIALFIKLLFVNKRSKSVFAWIESRGSEANPGKIVLWFSLYFLYVFCIIRKRVTWVSRKSQMVPDVALSWGHKGMQTNDICHASGTMDGNAGLSVGHHFGPDRNVLTTIEWIAIKFSINIHVPLKIMPTDFGDPLTSHVVPPCGWL